MDVSAEEAKELAGSRWVQVNKDGQPSAKQPAPKKTLKSVSAEPRDPDEELRDPRRVVPSPAADNVTGRGDDAAVDPEAHV